MTRKPATTTRTARRATAPAATTNEETTVPTATADPKPLTKRQQAAEAKRQKVLDDKQAELDATPARVEPAEPVAVASTAPRNAITESLKRGLSVEQVAKEHGVSVAKVKAAAAIVQTATKKAETKKQDDEAREAAKAEKEQARTAELERRAQRDLTIAAMAEDGKTVSEIAEAVELSVARTSQLLVKLGKKAASAPRGTANAERDAAICKAATEGESIEDASARTGLSVPRLRQILSAGGATKGRSSSAPAHDKSPEAEALRKAIAAVKACGVSMHTATTWERAERA